MSTREEWQKWHRQNPEFYRMFEKFTFDAINKGHKKLSPWLIVNRIRWETSMTTVGSMYKIRNEFIAYYSRLFMQRNPKYKGFFRTRPMKEAA